MARPKKQVVDYFSHDTDASQGRTMTVLLNKYGNDGYAFWFLLLELLGRSPGHFYNFKEPTDWEFLLAKTHISDAETVKDILGTLAAIGGIDPELYQQSIIWSQNFVDRLEGVYKKREENKPERPNSVVKTPISVTETKVSGGGNTQTKLNKSKLNKSKRNETKKGVSSPSSKEKEDENKALEKETERVLKVYKEEIGGLAAPTRTEIEVAINRFGSNWIIDAIREAVVQGQRRWVYIMGILKNWEGCGKEAVARRG